MAKEKIYLKVPVVIEYEAGSRAAIIREARGMLTGLEYREFESSNRFITKAGITEIKK